MKKIFKSMEELIGNTPVVRINNIDTGSSRLYCKLEYYNPMGSVKDRAAYGMITDAIEKGLIKKDTVIVEPTSGNTGIGLAFVCALMGIPLVLTMPDTMSIERRKILKGLGAELILTPGSEGMKGAIDKAKELVEQNENYFMPNQFSNPANPNIHSETTAKEILEVFDSLDFFVAGVGTGGTLTGVGRVLKSRFKEVKVVAVEPAKSAVISGNNPGPHKIQGIGAGFIPENLDVSLIDQVLAVEEKDAFENASLLLKKEGIFCGISGGANFSAALKLAKENENKDILCVIPDTGERYLSVEDFLK